MSIETQKARLTRAKQNFQIVLDYHEETVQQSELFSDYPPHVANIPFLLDPEEVDYNYGYVDNKGWHYEDNGGRAKNPIDIYKIQNGHSYFILLGNPVGSRFRVCTVSEEDDIRNKTSGIWVAQAINNENTPKNAWATMGGYANPDFSRAKTPFFRSTVDGYLLIQKDNNYTTGIKSYVFDISTPIGAAATDYTYDESMFDISNGIVTLKSSVDKSTLVGRGGIPATVNGQTVTGVGADCFNGCTGLAAVELPDTITSIGARAFKGCACVYFTIPATVTSIGDYAFEDLRLLREITVPSTVLSVGVGILKGCAALSVANFNAPVTTMDETFYNSPSAYISISSTVTTVTNGAFYNCKKFTSMSSFSNVTTIGPNAFNGCIGFENIEMPASVTSIGAYAFANCTFLQDITFTVTTPPTLANANAFDNTNDCPIYVPDAAVNTYKSASGWSDLSTRIFPVSDKVGA